MANYKAIEVRNDKGELMATPIVDVTADSTYKTVELVDNTDGMKLATPVIISKDGGSTGTETDPIWTAEKTNYYTKDEVDALIPSGGGSIYIESELVPSIEIPASGSTKTTISSITLPEEFNTTGADLKFNVQGNITRTGGGANNLGKLDIYVMNNGNYGTIFTAKKEVNRDLDISFDLHSKRYHVTNASPIYIEVSYTPTSAGETITLTNVTGWVE